MPFTFSHPAFVLPLNKFKWVSLTALVIGSVTPDFEYYIRIKDERIYTHTWSGLLWCDLPLGILLAFTFHNIVRNCLINNLPFWLQVRLIKYKDFNWNLSFKKRWFIILPSFYIAGIIHLLIDSFSHEDGAFAKRIPFLTSTIHLANFNIEGWMIIQSLTSFLGVIIIFFAIWRLPYNKKDIVNTRIKNFWIIACCITVAVYCIKLICGINNKIEEYIIPAISGFSIALIVTPLILKNIVHSEDTC